MLPRMDMSKRTKMDKKPKKKRNTMIMMGMGSRRRVQGRGRQPRKLKVDHGPKKDIVTRRSMSLISLTGYLT